MQLLVAVCHSPFQKHREDVIHQHGRLELLKNLNVHLRLTWSLICRYMYDGEMEAQMYMIFDANKHLISTADIYPEVSACFQFVSPDPLLLLASIMAIWCSKAYFAVSPS